MQSKTQTTPSFWRILDTDYIATFCAVAIVTLWGLYIVFKILSWNFRDEQFYLMFGAGITLVSLILIVYRFFILRRLFQVGQPARGKVLKSSFYRDRGRVVVEYSIKGEKDKRRSTTHLHTNRRTRAIHEGDWVTLVVDPASPGKTVIREAYLDQ
ncbi:MAG: hypothetical protein HY835_12165 [Anaerolineae bacterium]|nr:hypothetical protein [Anaerolineae bacterium]